MSTDAHARSDEIEKIPLAQQNSVSVELTAVDAAASRRGCTRNIGAFEVGAEKNRSWCAG